MQGPKSQGIFVTSFAGFWSRPQFATPNLRQVWLSWQLYGWDLTICNILLGSTCQSQKVWQYSLSQGKVCFKFLCYAFWDLPQLSKIKCGWQPNRPLVSHTRNFLPGHMGGGLVLGSTIISVLEFLSNIYWLCALPAETGNFQDDVSPRCILLEINKSFSFPKKVM